MRTSPFAAASAVSLLAMSALAAAVFPRYVLAAGGPPPDPVSTAHAAPAAVALGASGEECRFEPLLAELDAVRQDPPPNYFDAIRAELGVRKDILNAVLDCSVGKTDAIRARITALSPADAESKDLRASFARQLAWAREYFLQKKNDVPNLGIQGSRELAAELRSWRASNFIPLAAQSLNFIVWNQNQELFRSAHNRLTDIRKTMERLKLAESSDLRKLFQGAKTSLDRADRANRGSLEALRQFDASPESTLSAIKNSLALLAETYQAFFDLSTAVQEIIPN